jgi:ribosomal protein L11 methyltransferase
LIRLAVRVRGEEAELVLAELLELAPSGVEEVELPGGLVEFAVYGAPGELPALPALRAAADGALVEVRTEEVADDWAERWRQFHRPLVLEGRLTVRPPWEPPGDTPIDLVIDPGRAFGTGAHATTRLCLELLLDLVAEGPLVDVGCGSGVLAIAAAKLGFSPVLALDNDPVAVEVARGNAHENEVEIDVQRLDLRRDPTPVARTMTANLLRPLVLELARAWEAAPAGAPERLIASGLLAREAAEITEAFARLGLRLTARRDLTEWTALLLERNL